MLTVVTEIIGKRHNRISVVVSDEEKLLIDDWRRRQPDLPGRSEAIRRLINQALADDTTAAHARPKPRAGKAA